VLWKFSVPALLTNALGVAATWAAGALLVNRPNGYAEMGVFNAANQWRTALTFLPATNAAVALPIMASILNTGKSATDHPSVDVYYLVNAALIWFVALPIIVFAPWIMSLYGPGFGDRSMVMVLLIGGVAIGMLGNPMGTILQARGFMWLGLGCNSVWGILICLVSLLTVGRWGAAGLAQAYVIAYGVVMVALALHMRKKAVISPDSARTVLWGGITLASFMALTCMSLRREAPGESIATAAHLAVLAILLFYFGLGKAAKQNIPRLIKALT
jgi:O-antigen/teichoic acid export membrane protein